MSHSHRIQHCFTTKHTSVRMFITMMNNAKNCFDLRKTQKPLYIQCACGGYLTQMLKSKTLSAIYMMATSLKQLQQNVPHRHMSIANTRFANVFKCIQKPFLQVGIVQPIFIQISHCTFRNCHFDERP